MSWRGVVTSNVFLGIVLSVLAWPYSTNSLVVVSGLDPSWETTLAMAAHSGVPFGTHIVFTYGPLGFLQSQQLNYLWTTVADLGFDLALSTFVLGALVWSLRRAVPLIVAVAVAYVFGAVTIQHAGVQPEDVLAPVLVVCVAVLSRADADQASPWIWMVLGGVLSVFSLVKVSLGVGIAAALIVTVAFLPRARWRALEALVVGAIPTFCLCWFGTGNGFGNIIAFAKSSAAIISGYAPAMAVELPSRFYTYGLAVLVVVLIGGFAWAYGRGLPRRSRIGIWLVTLLIVWLLLKEGYVRHDAHDLIFFTAAPVVLAAYIPRRRSWVVVPAVLLLTGIFLIAAMGVLALVPRPDSAVRNLSSEVATVASPSRTAAVIEQSRRSLRVTYALSNRMVAMMRNQTVDVSPWEQTVAWAYPQFHFDPLPVIQDYSAYTPSLDQLDTSYLASSDAPRFILYEPGIALDGRNPAFEPPATQLAIECRYRQVSANTLWQILERVANRCGPPRLLGTVTTGFGHWVGVPTAPEGDAIVARFQLSQGWLSSLEAILFKPPEVQLRYDGSSLPWRFVASTAPDPHVLRAASTLGYYSGFVPVSLSRLRFSIAGRNPSAGGVKIFFYQVHVARVAGGNGEVIPKFLTDVLSPGNGTTVSGTKVIGATATDSFNVTRVEFYLTSASQNTTLIGTGGRTTYGWITLWNTTHVANGTYTLQSVAYDAVGRSSQSKSINVTVSN